MRRDRLEEQLHDFLDGRLDESERAALEARLKRDPELARRLEAYRSLGRALREDPPALGPGFYARARARFEESLGSRPSGRRWAFWEVAGLATAALILAALILPDMLPPSPPPEREVAAVPPHESEDLIEGAEQAGDLDQVSVPEPSAQAFEDLRKLAEETVAGTPEGRLRKAKEAGPSPAALTGKGALSARKDSVERNEPLPAVPPEADTFAPSPPPPAEHAPRVVGGKTVLKEPEDEKGAGALGEITETEKARQREFASKKAGTPMAGAGEGESADYKVLERLSSVGYITDEPATFRIVSSLEEWDRARAQPVSGSAPNRDPIPDFSTTRVVLIGPPLSPADCSSIRWEQVEGRVRIVLSPAPPDSPEPRGTCAVEIPAGQEPVEIVEPPEGPHEP